MKIKVAICQYPTELGNKENNIQLSLAWIEKACRNKPDLVILPELITSGYAAGEKHLEMAESVPGLVTDMWSKMARKHNCYIIAGLSRKDENIESIIYNSAVIITRQGSIEGIYSKVVLPLYINTWIDNENKPILLEEAEIFRKGDDLPVFKTGIGNLGLLICQDSVYGEFVRVLTLKGAQLIVQLFNHPQPFDDIGQDILRDVSRVHAWENGVYILAANKCGTEEFAYLGQPMQITFQGESHVVNPYGQTVAAAKIQEPDILVADIDLDLVKKAQWTEKFIRDYRPELLSPLTSMGVSLGKNSKK